MPSQYVNGTGMLASVVGLRKARLPLQLSAKGFKLVLTKTFVSGRSSLCQDVLLSVCVSVCSRPCSHYEVLSSNHIGIPLLTVDPSLANGGELAPLLSASAGSIASSSTTPTVVVTEGIPHLSSVDGKNPEVGIYPFGGPLEGST